MLVRSISTVLLLSCMIFFSCKKGDTGAAGKDGNANVVQYNFGSHDFTQPPVTDALVVNVKADTANRSQWFVYMYHPNVGRWYFLPGPGIFDLSQYSVNLEVRDEQTILYIIKVSGSGEIYSKIRMIRIYANSDLPGGRTGRSNMNNGLPNINFSDYETVRAYYHLPE